MQPGADIDTAITQINAASQTILRILPPRATPPEVLKYTPSTVPVVQLVMFSKSLSMEDVTDIEKRSKTVKKSYSKPMEKTINNYF